LRLIKQQPKLIFAVTLLHRRSLWMAGLALFLILRAAYPQAVPQWLCANNASNCHPVFIVHNSWHAAIVLRSSDLSDKIMPELTDFPAARFIEFSWGDKDYFPDPASGIFAAIKAALWSGGSVMHLVGFADAVEHFYRGATITELRLNATAYDHLVDYIDETFAREKSLGRARATPGLFSNSHFYPSNRNFSLLRTCNTWVAEALERAGLPISSGLVMTAANLHTQLLALQPAR
jgi:uncharacterized protein (TIGR02117 family)